MRKFYFDVLSNANCFDDMFWFFLGWLFQRILLWLWHFQCHVGQLLSHFCLLMEHTGQLFVHILTLLFSSISCRDRVIMGCLKVIWDRTCRSSEVSVDSQIIQHIYAYMLVWLYSGKHSNSRSTLEVPIFWFIHSDPLFVDKHYQAKGLSDMIIVVQSESSSWESHLQCNNRSLLLDLRLRHERFTHSSFVF